MTTDSASPAVKEYPLRLGSAKAPFGQFYGGLARLRGLRAFETARDRMEGIAR